jgi:GT2 family glycosyltransferase
MKPLITIPYIHRNEIEPLIARLGYDIPYVVWEDTGRIGSDLSYQTLWNMYPDRDIIILHADMLPMPEDSNNEWYYKLIEYADKYKEAGILGTTLLYPAKDNQGKYYIQHAGGRFLNGEAIHYGGGLELFSSKAVRPLESDNGQYDSVREVAWVTFGGIYLRRDMLNNCGSFDPSYHWTYYRDLDYCINARRLGWKIYQTPVKLLHFEGKDNKRIQSLDGSKAEKWEINKKIFFNKWKSSELVQDLDILIEAS